MLSYSVKSIYYLLIAITFYYFPSIIFAGVKDTNRVNIKFINESDHAIRLKVADDEVVFGLISTPVVYSSIPTDEEVIFEIQAIKENESINISDVSKVTNTGTSIFSVSKNAAEAAMKAQDLADEAAILQKELLLRAKYLKEIDGSPFREFAANVQVTEQATTLSQAAKASMGLGIASIGLSGIDWLCSEGQMKLSLQLKVDEIEDFEHGKELLIRITNDKVHYELREPPEARECIKCLVSTDSSKDILCSYKDAEGDSINIKLDKKRFHSGEIEIDANAPELLFYEVVRHKNSFLHHSFVLTRGVCSSAVAIIDPFPVTKAFSAIGAAADLSTGTVGLVHRFYNFFKKITLKKKGCSINIYDKNLKTRVKINENN